MSITDSAGRSCLILRSNQRLAASLVLDAGQRLLYRFLCRLGRHLDQFKPAESDIGESG